MKIFLSLIIIFFLSLTSANAQTKIGLILPLSGDSAFIGTDIQRGINLALDEIPEAREKLTLIYEDNQFSQAKSALAARKLIDIDKVDIIISLWDAADVIAPIVEKQDILQISIRWDPKIAEEYTHTMVFEAPYMCYADEEIKIIKQSGIKNIAIIDDGTKSNELFFSYINPLLQKENIHLVERLTFNNGYSNSKAALIKLLHKKPEIILLNLFMPDIELVTKDLLSLDFQKISGFLDILTDSKIKLKLNMPFIAGMDFNPDFVKRFQAKYNSDPVIRAPVGYDLIKMIMAVLKQKLDIKNQESFKIIKDFSGESGLINYHSPGKLFFKCKQKQYKDGVMVNPTLPEAK